MINIEINNVAKRLLLIRGLRSLGQGAMVVDLTLYLKDLNWSGAAIGGVTSAAGIVGATLILIVGILSDRMGRKPFLIVYEGLTMLAAISASLTTQAIIIALAIVLAGFGRGQNGAAGPFSPAEQAWLARLVKRANRGMVFSLNNAIGFIGMAIGAVIGGVPGFMPFSDPLTAYRPVFLVVAGVSLLCMLLLLSMHEETENQVDTKELEPIKSDKQLHPQGVDNNKFNVKDEVFEEAKIRKQENIAMLKLALINSINGLAIGLTGPLMAYWFSIRYGVSSAEIGMTLSVGFLLTGISSIINGFLAQKIGMVKSSTWMRAGGAILTLILPLMPNFTVASILYVVRNAVNRGSTGNRSAVGASLTRDKRRGLATSINALSMRLPSSFGPTITGYLFDMGQLSLPLMLTAVLQFANAGLYQIVFGKYDVRKERKIS